LCFIIYRGGLRYFWMPDNSLHTFMVCDWRWSSLAI